MEVSVCNDSNLIRIQDKEGTEQNERIKYLKEIEIVKLLSNIENELHSLLFQFLFETGARCTEALMVRINDIDPYNKTVKLITLKRKGGKVEYRVLGISDALLNKILLYDRKIGLKSGDFLFVRKSGDRHISIQAVNQALKRYVVDILGPGYKQYGHPHVFRHSRAIQLLNSGKVDLVKLMRILGHANIRNTLIYTQFANKEIQNAMRKANEVIGIY